MFFDNDLDVFLSTDEFAEDITWNHGNSVSGISGIFDSPGTTIMVGIVPTYIERPQVILKTSDIPNADNSDTFEIRSTTYKVVSLSPDGTGLTTIVLAEGKR